jgi:DNA-binding protein HU-beta
MPAKKTTTAAPKSAAKPAAKVAAKPAARSAAKAAPARGVAKGGKAATAGGATVTLRHIAAELTESHDMLNKKQADAVLSDMVDVMVRHLKMGDRVRIGGLGILQVRSRAARMGRNPATGEQIQIKASKKVAFRPAKELKEAI